MITPHPDVADMHEACHARLPDAGRGSGAPAVATTRAAFSPRRLRRASPPPMHCCLKACRVGHARLRTVHHISPTAAWLPHICRVQGSWFGCHLPPPKPGRAAIAPFPHVLLHQHTARLMLHCPMAPQPAFPSRHTGLSSDCALHALLALGLARLSRSRPQRWTANRVPLLAACSCNGVRLLLRLGERGWPRAAVTWQGGWAHMRHLGDKCAASGGAAGEAA